MTLDVFPGYGEVVFEPGLICWPKFCFRTIPFSYDYNIVHIPGGYAIVLPLDATGAFGSDDLVFWDGAKAF